MADVIEMIGELAGSPIRLRAVGERGRRRAADRRRHRAGPASCWAGSRGSSCVTGWPPRWSGPLDDADGRRWRRRMTAPGQTKPDVGDEIRCRPTAPVRVRPSGDGVPGSGSTRPVLTDVEGAARPGPGALGRSRPVPTEESALGALEGPDHLRRRVPRRRRPHPGPHAAGSGPRADPAQGTAGQIVDGCSSIWVILAVPVVLNVIGALTFRNAEPSRTMTCPSTTGVLPHGDPGHQRRGRAQDGPGGPDRPWPRRHCSPTASRSSPTTRCPSVDGCPTILVPKATGPPHGPFKARALHYALEASPISDTTWLFHLDEETHITPSVIRGSTARSWKRRPGSCASARAWCSTTAT